MTFRHPVCGLITVSYRQAMDHECASAALSALNTEQPTVQEEKP